MPKNARLTDQADCFCRAHGIRVIGEIVTASEDVIVNNLGQARIDDIVRGSCGHTGKIITGSPNVYANNRKIARIGDQVDGIIVGTIISGSPDTITNSEV